MPEYEEKEECDIWGYLCHMNNTQINEFRKHALSSDLQRERNMLESDLTIFHRKVELQKAREVTGKIMDVDIRMYDDARQWFLTHVAGQCPDTLPPNL